MKKIAYVASVSGHFRSFHLPHLKSLSENGYEVTTISKDDILYDCCDKSYQVPIERSPFNKENIKAYTQLKEIFASEQFNIIHCHTPVASILTRLAARKLRKKGTKIIYTAHGFHFYKGAPLLYWLMYFPIEWICSFFTDELITINQEDYSFAKKHLHAKKTCYINGVGVDLQKHKPDNTKTKKELLGIEEDAIALLSVGELSKRKNHETILKALAKLNNPDIHYFVAGKGDLCNHLETLAKELGVENNFHLLGYRNDIKDLLSCSDIFCFPSIHEGLPVSVMEAMAMGLPCVVSKIRGNTDLIDDGKGGFLCSPTAADEYAEKILILAGDAEKRKEMELYNIEKVKAYSIEEVKKEMSMIYNI